MIIFIHQEQVISGSSFFHCSGISLRLMLCYYLGWVSVPPEAGLKADSVSPEFDALKKIFVFRLARGEKVR